MYPSQDEHGNELQQARRRRSGSICGGYKLVFLQFCADWKYSREAFNLEWHYNCKNVCDTCTAVANPDDPQFYASFHINNPCFSSLRCTAIYNASAAGLMSPLRLLLGFFLASICPEMMHAGPLGIHLAVLGSVLLELAREGMWGRFEQHGVGRWKDRLNLQLANAYTEFRDFCKRKRLNVQQRRWTVAKLSMRKQKDRPLFKSKAWPALVIVDWLSEVCTSQAAQRPHNEYVTWRAGMLWGLKTIFCVFRFGTKWLTDRQIQKLNAARDA